MKSKTLSIVTYNELPIGQLQFLSGSYFLFSFFLPLHTGISNALLILSIVLSVIFLYRNPDARTKAINTKMLLYSVLPFFLLHVMGLFYTNYPEDGYRYIEKTISFLLIPIIFLYFHKEVLIKLSVILLKGLLFGSVISVLILLALNISNYFINQDTFSIGKDVFDYYHTNKYFTQPLNQHPTYLGVYYLTSIIFIRKLIKSTWLKIILATVFIIGFLFLNSRIIFISILLFLILLLLKGTYGLFKKKKYNLILIYGLILGTVIFSSLKFLSGTFIGYRIKNIYKFEVSMKNEEQFNSKSKANPRMARWISALKLVEKRPLFGYGIADEYPNLKRQFEADKMYTASKMEYNAHNQFIGYAVRFGIVGVFILGYFFFLNTKLVLATKDYNYAVLILIIFCVSMVENFFDRNYGITFSAVFLTIFSYRCLLRKSI